jgi:hypothetical protein
LKAIVAVLAIAGVVGLTTSAEAQAGKFSLPKSAPRQARTPTAAERAKAAPVLPAPVYHGQSAYPAYPVAYVLLPAVIMSDGRVYADFGYGYESVSRGCGAGVALTTYTPPPIYPPPTMNTGTNGGIPVVAGNGTVLANTVSPPPVQPSRSYENLPHHQQARREHDAAQAAAVQQRARDAASCWRQDHSGFVVVFAR